MSLIVVKLGGSLLTCPEFPERLRLVLAEQVSARVLIVVGGGLSADAVREWSEVHSLADSPAHWIAIRSLSVTRGLVAELLPECRDVASEEHANQLWQAGCGPLLLDIEAYLRQTEPADDSPLPHSWNVTSDSIAAWVADRWKADKLILLKSTGLERDTTLEQAARMGLVDAHFPNIAIKVPRIVWCNLLEERPRCELWFENHVE